MKIEFSIYQHGRRYCSMIDEKHCNPKCREKRQEAKTWGGSYSKNLTWVCLAHDSRMLEIDEAGFIAFENCQKKAAAIIKKLEKEKEKAAAKKEQGRLFNEN